jgi:hypothetical protein
MTDPAASPQQAREATSAWQADAHAKIQARERSRAWRRWVDLATLLVMVATTALVALTAVPVALGLVLDEHADPAHRGIARAMRARGYAVGPPEPPSRSEFAPTDSEGRLMAPRLGILSEDGAHGSKQVGAIAKGAIELRESANLGSPTVVDVPGGQLLLIVEDGGAWVLLAVKHEDRIKLGWAQRSQLLVLE